MLNRIFVIIVALLIVVAMFAFAWANPGEISIDLLFFEWTTHVPAAFTAAFAIGWVFGLLCAGVWMLGLARERRNLKRALRASETEVSSLRSLPMSDAD